MKVGGFFGWILTPLHALLALIGAAVVYALADIMIERFFGAAEPKKKLKIQRIHTENSALFEAVNNTTTLELEVRRHGVIYYDDKDNTNSGTFSARLKAGASVPLNIASGHIGGDTQALFHAFKYHQGAVYYIWAEDTAGDIYCYYPDGKYWGFLKRQWYRLTGKEVNLPHGIEMLNAPNKYP